MKGEFRAGRRVGRASLRGITVLELILFIAVVSLMCTFALEKTSKIRSGPVKNLRDRRNAQTLCTVSSSAQALGLDMVVPGDVMATIDNLVAGGVVPAGVFKGEVMSVPGITEDEKVTAALYLRIEHGMLRYEGLPTE